MFRPPDILKLYIIVALPRSTRQGLPVSAHRSDDVRGVVRNYSASSGVVYSTLCMYD